MNTNLNTDIRPAETTQKAPKDQPDIGRPTGIRARGYSDQDGGKYVIVRKDDNEGEAPLELMSTNAPSFWALLFQQGVIATATKTKTAIQNEIDGIKAWPMVGYVARRPGFHAGAFVKPDGSIIGTPRAPNFKVLFPRPPVLLTHAGTLQEWQKLVRRYVRGQPHLTVALCLGFVGPLLRFSPYPDNVSIEYVGDSSTGKSTALSLCASVWGAPYKLAGSIAAGWRGTVAGLEALMLARDCAVFPLDEASAGGADRGNLTKKLVDAVFLIGDGYDGNRYTNPATAEAVTLACLSTSNVAIDAIVAGLDEDSRLGVQVRMISLPVPNGKGVWDSLPPGIKTFRKASVGLASGLQKQHGHAIDAFLERLVRELNRDEAKLRASIAQLADSWLEGCNVDEASNGDGRRAQAFAMIYVAGKLATEWEVLPKLRLRHALVSIQTISRGITQSMAGESAFDRVLAYVKEHQNILRDLDSANLRRLELKELNASHGFLKTIKGDRCLLLRKKAWEGIFGSRSHKARKELQASERLHCDGKSLQIQIQARSNSPKDRFYAVRL